MFFLGVLLLPIWIFIIMFKIDEDNDLKRSLEKYRKQQRTCKACGRYNKYPDYESHGFYARTYKCKCGEELFSELDD